MAIRVRDIAREWFVYTCIYQGMITQTPLFLFISGKYQRYEYIEYMCFLLMDIAYFQTNELRVKKVK